MGSYVPSYSPFDRSHLSYYEKAPYDEDEILQPSSMGDISRGFVEDLARILAGLDKGRAPANASDIYVKDDGEDEEVQKAASDHLPNGSKKGIMVGNIRQASTVLEIPAMNFVATRGDACSHSGLKGDSNTFEAYYKLMGDRYPEHKETPHGKKYVQLRQAYEIVQFTYDITTGRASYLLACDKESYKQYVSPLKQALFSNTARTHPFAPHLFLIARMIIDRGVRNDKTLCRVMMLEEKYLRGNSKVTYDSPDETKHQLQVLHSLLLDLVLSFNENKRHLSNIEHRMHDLKQIEELQKTVQGAHVIDPGSQQRLVDGFRSLKDYCENRGLRLASRQQRVQNLVNLTYNLLANRDSKVNQDIAFEARQDSGSMMTIAVLTMIFLPATFVSSILGSNLFALEDNGAGKHSFVASDLWWIYLVTAIPLTMLTVGAWIFWQWRRPKWLERLRRKGIAGMN